MNKSISSFTFIIGVIVVLLIITLSVLGAKHSKLHRDYENLNQKYEMTKRSYERQISELKAAQALCKERKQLTTDKLISLLKPYVKNYVPMSLVTMQIDAALEMSDPLLILSLIAVESNFDPMAKSSAGAIGCGQVKPKFWDDELKRQGIISEYRDYFDPTRCVYIANYVLEKKLHETNNIFDAIVLYYCGNEPCKAGKQHAVNVLSVYGNLLWQLNNQNKN